MLSPPSHRASWAAGASEGRELSDSLQQPGRLGSVTFSGSQASAGAGTASVCVRWGRWTFSRYAEVMSLREL
jgi:hypothetical protein